MIDLREARPDDCADVWRWNTAPEVRANSRSTDAIPYADHVGWFASRLERPLPMWIVEERGVPVGVVRLDRHGARVHISIALAANARGRGIGARAIRAACERWGAPIVAEIAAANESSRACFEKCAFVRRSEDGEFLIYDWRP